MAASSEIVKLSIRKQLEDHLRTEDEFNAFCIDHFPAIFRNFSHGMSRTQKTNLLFTAVSDPTEIKRALDLQVKGRYVAITPNAISESPKVFARRAVLTLITAVPAIVITSLVARKQCGFRDGGIGPDNAKLQDSIAVAPRSRSPQEVERLRVHAINVLLALLQHSDPTVQLRILDLVISVCDGRLVSLVAPCLKPDRDLSVQIRAAEALAQLGVPLSVEQQKRIEDPSTPAELQSALLEVLYRATPRVEPYAVVSDDRIKLFLRRNSSLSVRGRLLRILANTDTGAQGQIWNDIQPIDNLSVLSSDKISALWFLACNHHRPAITLLARLLESDSRLKVALHIPVYGDSHEASEQQIWKLARAVLVHASKNSNPERLQALSSLSQLRVQTDETWVLTSLREVAYSERAGVAERTYALRGLGARGQSADIALLADLLQKEKMPPPKLAIEIAGAFLRLVSGLPEQIDAQSLDRADAERRSGGGLDLLASMSAIDALNRALDWLEKSSAPSPKDAVVARKLFDHLWQQRTVGMNDSYKRMNEISQRLSSKDVNSRQVIVLLSNDIERVTQGLSDTDSSIRQRAAARMVANRWLTPWVISILNEKQSNTVDAIYSYGLLRQAGILAAFSSATEFSILNDHSSSNITQQLGFVEALGSWPFSEARNHLNDALRSPQALLRRRVLDSFNEILEREPNQGENVCNLISSLRSDLDAGVRLRVQSITHRFSGTQLALKKSRSNQGLASSLSMQSGKRTSVHFSGEAGVRFTLDGKERLLRQDGIIESVIPGPYRISWVDGSRVITRALVVPPQERLEYIIPVSASRQKTPLL